MVVLSRKERDRQLRRSDILKAAEHLFALRGYHKATIRDIAREAQYATGTVYLHFRDKDDLYFALLEEKIKSLLSIIKERTGQTKDARKKIEVFIKEGLSFFEKNQDFFQIFVSEGNELSSEKQFFHSPTGLQMREDTTKLIREAQIQGVINRNFAPEIICDVFLSIVKTITLRWLHKKNRLEGDLIDLSETILRLFLNGAGN